MTLADDLRDARERTLALVSDFTADDWLVPQLEIVNPPLWELGHVAWFQERWVLREFLGGASLRDDADELFDSIEVHHHTRWDLLLPSLDDTLAYARSVLDAALEVAEHDDARAAYFVRLATFHEDMHGEAFTYTRQTLGRPAPPPHGAAAPSHAGGGPLPGDVEVSGGRFVLGASPDEPFVFDNEKWGHEVEIAPFWIARAPVTQAEFAEFVEADGYRESSHWCEEGRAWLAATGAEHPQYWMPRDGGGWSRRHFDQVVALEDHLPVTFVNWFEATAYCRWAGRRLPTEAEWECAASFDGARKRRFPWGDEPPTPERAALDARSLAPAPVDAHPEGESPVGCRQMIGNVWEWTASTFVPYPGYVVDPYKDYSEPWFGSRKVLRGGCHVTRARMLRNTWRNFFTPDRRDVFAGFRTAAGRMPG